MNKPNWKDAPEWANWLAMDGDGDWYWYEHEPKLARSVWFDPAPNPRNKRADTVINWYNSKEPRPKGGDSNE